MRALRTGGAHLLGGAIWALVLLATGFYFLCARAGQASLPIGFRVLGLLSMLPLGFGVDAVVRRPGDWWTPTRLVTRIIWAMTAFYMLMDALTNGVPVGVGL